ncbi:7-deoxyloganetin glucosyltransferase-like [Impatiens glandulifera]|uniref:7-deoxyloganetin glucosyltransferase-like n=1 Tax=Impatiens glandulifera TaxID=253017 RepID=UPI001FB0976B|nr:7-deoxyloganetin glucosyltransferase-like [Impatiens glandulifera]
METIGKFEHKSHHVVLIPYPAQGHVSPMLKLAKLLYSTGFHVTFVNTEYNHARLLNSRGPSALDGLPGFRFCTIPDGLPPSPNIDATQDIPSLCNSTSKNCLEPFSELLAKIMASDESPPISCIISDGAMSFTLDAAERFGIPEVLFWTTSACGFLGYTQFDNLMKRGIIPPKDESYLTNGYLDTILEFISGMNDIKLRDLPSFLRTTDPNDLMLNFIKRETSRASMASAIIINTFHELESQVLNSLSSFLPPIYSIGPLNLISIKPTTDEILKSIGSNLWKEETDCIDWLNSKKPRSVVLVNFGSITVMSSDQMKEFAWGLANSEIPFLWVIRPDLVIGESAMLPPEFASATKERGKLSSWCPQEQVLQHEAIGGFLTHSGWNSTLEAICGGVPILSWPFFAEQQTNCRYSCVEWGIGMEIDNDVKREKVEMLVKEMMEGEKGKEMKMKVMEWKKKAEEAVLGPNGSSYINFQKLIKSI